MADKNVMAEVNGVSITQEDVVSFIQSMGKNGTQFMSSEGMQIIANEMINQELLYLDAVDNKLHENDEFVLQLEESKRNLLKNYAMYTLFKDIEITDEDIRKYYDENREIIKSSYKYNADHILVDSEDKANELMSQVNNDNFADLARENSTCPSKDQGGNLGDFESGQMVQEFDQALEQMNEGDIEGPVKSQFGYHIIKLNSKELVREASFENLKEQLKSQLLMMKQQELYTKKAGEIEKDYQVNRYF